MIVAIDGPAGAGKSTIAARTAEKSGFLYLNSGNFYRSISKAILASDVDPENTQAALRIARRCRFDLKGDTLLLNGEEVKDIHNQTIDQWSSIHSCIPQLRKVVNRALKRLSKNRNIVVEGRDMSTVVFPQAEIKIFLDASLEARAKRRFLQGESTLSQEQIRDQIGIRDHRDRNKPVGKLVKANEATTIDTSDLTIDEVCDRVVREIHRNVNQSGEYN